MNASTDLAPVVIFCYNRPRHFQLTIESLQQNTLASQTDLIIYSDGAKNESDRHLINELRTYIAKISGFRSVKLITSDTNQGLAQSIIQGVTEVLSEFQKAVVLEDDMLSTPDFLDFMNESLNVFEHRPDIFSITGYVPPMEIPDNYNDDLFLAPRASSWGWATWLDKWQKADWMVSDFKLLRQNAAEQRRFSKGGDDLWPMLAKQQLGIIESWAIRWTYAQFKNNAFGVYPVHSKIKNIGTDGSGTNFTFTSYSYGDVLNMATIRINPDLRPNEVVIKAFGSYYHLPFYLKIKNWIKYGIRLN